MAAELPADIITLPEDSNGTVQYKQAEHSISSECLQMPVREFMDSTWHLLGIYLDGTNESRTGLGVAKDWRGLAELTNIAPSDMEKLNTAPAKTKAILWHHGSTVGHLQECLVEMERFDILTDRTFLGKLEADCQKYHVRLKKKKEETNEALVIQDVLHGQVTKFDAFLSFCETDRPEAKELVRILENIYEFRICIDVRDLIPGASTFFTIADIMAERCGKIILLMSPAFLKSPECEFQMNVALKLSVGEQKKRLLPILHRPCDIPWAICYIESLRSTDDCFLKKLTASLSVGGCLNKNHERDGSPKALSWPSINRYREEELWKEETSHPTSCSLVPTRRSQSFGYDRNVNAQEYLRAENKDERRGNSSLCHELLSPYNSEMFGVENLKPWHNEQTNGQKEMVALRTKSLERPLGHPDITELCPSYGIKG